MRLFELVAALAATVAATAIPEPIPAGASIIEARTPLPAAGHKDKWGCNKPAYRHKVTIRFSKNDTDDISNDFLWGLHEANNGGTLVLKEGKRHLG